MTIIEFKFVRFLFFASMLFLAAFYMRGTTNRSLFLNESQPSISRFAIPYRPIVSAINDKPLYDSDKVLEFRKSYLRKLIRSDNSTLLAIYFDKGYEQGFCSWFNMMLMAFDYATFQGINRLFLLNTDTFGYGEWTDYFYPMESIPETGTLSSSLKNPESKSFMTSLDIDKSTINGLEVGYFLVKDASGKRSYFASETNQPKIQRLGLRHVTGSFYNKIYLEFNTKIQEFFTIEELIAKRRIIAQAIWEPLPVIKRKVETIQSSLKAVDGSVAKSFMALNVRRGDKIALGESSDISPSVYADKIYAVLNSSATSPIDCILVISDDEDFFKLIQNEVTKRQPNGISVISISKYLDHDHLISRGWQQNSLSEASSSERKIHTTNLIVSLTLMTKAQHVICGFSSNICRAVQLLRKQDVSTITTLDYGWFPF